MQLSEDELTTLIQDVDLQWSPAERDNFLKRLSQSYEPFRQVPATTQSKKGTKNKGKKPPVEPES